MQAFWSKYKEQIMYLFFGVLTTVVSFVSYGVLTRLLAMHYLGANILSWVTAVLFAYFTNRKMVFGSQARGFTARMREFLSFVAGRLFSAIVDMALMYASIDLLGINDMLAKAVITVIVVVLNYIASKYFAFRKNNN